MKQQIGVDLGSYIFQPGTSWAGSITLIGVPDLDLEDITLVYNATAGVCLYDWGDPTLSGQLNSTTNVLALECDTSAMNTTDRLMILVNLPVPLPNINIDLTDNDNFVEPTETIPTATVPFISGQRPISMAQPVALANEQIFDLQGPLISMTSPPVGQVLALQDCLQYRQVAFQIDTSAGISAGILSFETSNGLGNVIAWSSLTLTDVNNPTVAGVTSVTLAASTSRCFAGPVNMRYVRIRVTTAVAGGSVHCLPVYRMAPYYPPGTVAATVNTTQWGTNNVVTGGVVGSVGVGGNLAPGVAPTMNPITIGGVDYSNLIRRLLTDSQGHLAAAGPDPSRTGTTNPVINREADPTTGRRNSQELLELILLELKLISYYLKETPMLLNMGASFKDEITDLMPGPDQNI